MTSANFDEQLRRAFDTLADRLRDDIAQHLQTTTDELATTVRAERDTAAADATRDAWIAAEQEISALKLTVASIDAQSAATQEQAARAEDDTRRANARLRDAQEQIRAAHEQARLAAQQARQAEEQAHQAEEQARQAEEQARQATEQARRAEDALQLAEAQARDMAQQNTAVPSAATPPSASDSPAGERLLDAVRALDRARSLSEILDTIVSCAGREASRAAVLLVRGAELHGWRAIGFGPALDAGGAIRCSLAESGVLSDAVRSREVVSTSSRAAAPAFANLPGDCAIRALPLTVTGRVVAVLYADQGGEEASVDFSPGALEVIARHAARTLESLTMLRATQAAAGPPAALATS